MHHDPNETPVVDRFSRTPFEFQHLLLAVDATPASEDAVHWASSVARAHGSVVTVAHVAPTTYPFPNLGAVEGPALASWLHAQYARGRDLVARVCERLGADGVKTVPVVVQGEPVDELVRIAGGTGADLVVMGDRASVHLVERVFLGSVADGVKDRVGASVLIARTTPPPKRILVGVDGSLEAREATGAAIALGAAWRVPVTAVHAHPLPFFTMGEAPWTPEQVVERATGGHPGLDVEPFVIFDKPQRGLVRAADHLKADLVVVGCRGGRLRGRPGVGGVTNAVAHRSPGSVLIVRGPTA